jgi:TonB family protein
VFSLLLHAGLIVGTILLQAHIDTLPADDRGPASAQFLYPLVKPMPRPVQEQITYVGMNGFAKSETPVGSSPNAPLADATPPAPTQLAIEEIKAPEPPQAFSEIEVDSAAVRDPTSIGPTYPQKLLDAKVEGGTRVQFVVDSTGHVDIASLVILISTHPEFTQAVRDALPRMKYQPARLGKRPVAQLVEQHFGFRIAPP